MEIQIEPEDEEDNWSDDEGCDFQLEDGIDTQFVMDGQTEGGEGQEDKGDDTAIDVMAEKLDNMLLLVYHYLREVCKDQQVVRMHKRHMGAHHARATFINLVAMGPRGTGP